MKQHTYWVMTHSYPNGHFRAGVVSNTKIGAEFDVIAYEDDFSNWKTRKRTTSLRHVSVDEALAVISTLARAVSYYVETKKDKKL